LKKRTKKLLFVRGGGWCRGFPGRRESRGGRGRRQ
jgi:hypothetical protein